MTYSRPPSASPASRDLAGRTAIVLGSAADVVSRASATLEGRGARVVVAGHDLPPDVSAVDVLVHCAEPASPPASDAVTACLGAVRRLAPMMAARRRGSVIVVSSPRPSCAGRGDDPPSSMRGPLAQMVRSLAVQMRPFSVRINMVSAVDADPAPGLAFLASDASAHVTGSVLALSAGWSALERFDDPASPVEPLLPLPVPLPVRRGGAVRPGDGGFGERRRA